MSSDLSRPVTWNSVVRVGLLWGAEYGVLSMIEDSSVAVRAATVFCAIGALAALELRGWLDSRREGLFRNIAIALALLWGYFIYVALAHSLHINYVREGLKKRYLESSSIVQRASDLGAPAVLITDPNTLKEEKDLIVAAKDWERRTAEWVEKHAGPVARERFMDTSAMPSLNWGPMPWDVGFSSRIDLTVIERRNLAALIDSPNYD